MKTLAIGRRFSTALRVAVISLTYGPQPGGRPRIKLQSTWAVGLAAMLPGYRGGDDPAACRETSTACRHRAPRKREEATGTSSVRQTDHRLS